MPYKYKARPLLPVTSVLKPPAPLPHCLSPYTSPFRNPSLAVFTHCEHALCLALKRCSKTPSSWRGVETTLPALQVYARNGTAGDWLTLADFSKSGVDHPTAEVVLAQSEYAFSGFAFAVTALLKTCAIAA